jgi:LysM domain
MRVSRLRTAAPLLGLALLVATDADARGRTSSTGRGRTQLRNANPSPPREVPSGRYYEITGKSDLRSPRFGVVGKISVPVYHTVRRGDTLWSLCAGYFRDPWRWPKVWSFNPSITNPHWIYPGNKIRMRPGKETLTAPGKQTVVGAYAKRQKLPSTIYLKQRGFIEEDAMKYKAKITGSREEKIMLATFDQVYIRFTKKKPLKVGERYSIYKAIKPVIHPHHKRSIGQMVEIYGEVEIKEITKARMARGVILKAVNPIERGYLVGKIKRVFKAIKPVKNTNTRVTGSVVAVLNQSHLIGAKQLVFIDRGKKYKVRVGYTFYVTRRGDAFRRLAQFKQKRRPTERKWPKEFVAQIIVVDIGWNHAVGYVSKTLKELRLGDRVELQVDEVKKKKKRSR